MADDRFTDAVSDATAAEGDEALLAGTLLGFLPIDGAAISTLGETLGSETVSATDALAARLDEVQFDLGDGPCWQAMTTRQPVLEADFHNRTDPLWPAFTAEMSPHDIGAIFAFPLLIGPLQIGAIDLYSASAGALNTVEVAQMSVLATLISRIVLRRALRLGSEEATHEGGTTHSRRLVHQATGMVIAQLHISPEDALLLIQGHAFAGARTMLDVAAEIVEGRLHFTLDRNGIEDRP